MVVFFSVGRLLRLWEMHQGRRETVEPDLLPHRNFYKTVSLFPVKVEV